MGERVGSSNRAGGADAVRRCPKSGDHRNEGQTRIVTLAVASDTPNGKQSERWERVIQASGSRKKEQVSGIAQVTTTPELRTGSVRRSRSGETSDPVNG
jgi:hypothetical protein